MSSTPPGLKKEQLPLAEELIKRGYEIGRDGNNHFPVTWQGKLVTAFSGSPRSMTSSLLYVRAAVRRFERANGLFRPQKKTTAARRSRQAPGMSGFTMPSHGTATRSPQAPSQRSLEPSQYTVASMLGADAMEALARATLPVFKEPELTETRTKDWRSNPRRSRTDDEKRRILADFAGVPNGNKMQWLKDHGLHHSNITAWTQQLASRPQPEPKPVQRDVHTWSEEEMAAVVFRYRRATAAWRAWNKSGRQGAKPQPGVELLRELGIGNGHITWFTDKLRATGRYPQLDPEPAKTDAIPFVTVPESAEVFTEAEPAEQPEPVVDEPVIIAEQPVLDVDELIAELTAQWTELIARKRELAAARALATERIDALLAEAGEVEARRNQMTVEINDVQADIAKARKRIAELVKDE